MGYSFYDITYNDESDQVKELRIFYKGELKLENNLYNLTFSKRNLNFLENKKKTS
jgi:hypothetical protein